MTPKQAAWLERYQRETAGYQIHAIGDGEALFSWRECDTCGCSKGGDRYNCTLTNPGPHGEPYAVSSCVDCVMFAANGSLPPDEHLE